MFINSKWDSESIATKLALFKEPIFKIWLKRTHCHYTYQESRREYILYLQGHSFQGLSHMNVFLSLLFPFFISPLSFILDWQIFQSLWDKVIGSTLVFPNLGCLFWLVGFQRLWNKIFPSKICIWTKWYINFILKTKTIQVVFIRALFLFFLN